MCRTKKKLKKNKMTTQTSRCRAVGKNNYRGCVCVRSAFFCLNAHHNYTQTVASIETFILLVTPQKDGVFRKKTKAYW